jgi:ubiquinol-cytochrome c reductase cytochrome b subunit
LVKGRPDRHLGWLGGAPRLYPPWEARVFGYEIPNVFVPALLLPGITFAFLYAWSLLERKVTGDDAEHQVLERPRDRPVRAVLGVATLSFYVVLLVSASNDLIAKWLRLSVEGVTWSMRALLLTVPPAAGYVILRTCAALSGIGGTLDAPPAAGVPLPIEGSSCQPGGRAVTEGDATRRWVAGCGQRVRS